MDMLDAELTYLDAEIQRINNEINYTIQDVVNSTPRINAPDIRRRHDRRTSIDTASVSDVYVPLPTSIRVPRSARQISSIGGADRAPSPRRTGSRSSPVADPPQSVPRPKNLMKPATYDGTGLWNDYLSHFESVSLINHWTDLEKGLYLAASLRGQAQGVLGNQATGDRQNYQKLVQALQDRFAPSNQTELYRAQLRERRQKASETLPEMGQDIRRLTNLAYPTASSELKEVLATEQFLDGFFDPEMRLKIKQARPVNLNDAIQRAVELEAFNRAERRRKENIHVIDKDSSDKGNRMETLMEEMQKSISLLQQDMKSLKKGQTQGRERDGPTRRYNDSDGDRGSGSLDQRLGPSNRPGNRDRKCYNCQSPDHFARNCPHPPKDGYKKTRSTGQQDNPKEDTKKVEQCSRNIHIIKESGLYVKALVGGIETSLLIDTGATISLLSRVLFETLSNDNKYEIKGVSEPILSANGTPMDVLGQTEVSITIGESTFQQMVVIADFNMDGVIGLDFMKTNDCIIDVQKDILSILGTQHQILSEGISGSYKVSIVNRISIPPRTEVVTQGKICATGDGKLPARAAIIEPVEKFLRSDIGVVAKTLVRSQEIVPIRIANLSGVAQTIYPGTIVGELSPIEEVMSPKGSHEDCKVTEESDDMPRHIKELFDRCSRNLNPVNRDKARTMLLKYAHVFSTSDEDVGRAGTVKHKIDTGTNVPIKQAPRRLPVHMQQEVDTHVAEMLRRGVIEPSNSPWSSPIVLVKKKDGSTRFCVDYRRLNSITTKDAYPLPKIDESLSQLNGSRWFCTLDMNSGYWQVELDQNDKHKTAFATRQGLYEFNVMPFGLCNAPATFERLVDTVLSGLQWDICLIYLDDIIVYGKTFDETLQNLEKVFEKLLSAGLKLKARKCSLFAEQVKYLGHVISKRGIETDPDKISVVENWPQPIDKTQVRSFIGLCSYYRKFIPKFADIARPLHKLTEKNVKFQWTDECQRSFELLKQKLVSAPILASPDFNEPFILDTDASNDAIGAVLSQVIDGKERPIAYASKALSKSERRYCVTRKELLAVVVFIKHFRHFLYGRKFLIRTDHSSLRWLMRFKDPEGQLARWLEVISAYELEIQHRAGKQHGNADSLSRLPCSQCGFYDDWEEAEQTEHVRKVSPGGYEGDTSISIQYNSRRR